MTTVGTIIHERLTKAKKTMDMARPRHTWNFLILVRVPEHRFMVGPVRAHEIMPKAGSQAISVLI